MIRDALSELHQAGDVEFVKNVSASMTLLNLMKMQSLLKAYSRARYSEH